MERRGVLRLFTLLFGALCGGSGLVSLIPRRAGGGWQPVAPETDVPATGAKRSRVAVRAGWETTERPIYLMREGDAVVAIDARCTHLGCTVRWKEDEFRCPCHAGVFDGDGKPVSGPVSEPLRRLETRVRNGQVEVRS